MPVNSFSFKINVPTNDIPIATSVAVTSYQSPPDTVPSDAIELSTLTYSSTGVTVTVPHNSGLLVIKSTVPTYQIIWFVNRTGTNKSQNFLDPLYYTILNVQNNVGLSFYGTDGVLSNMLLLNVSDTGYSDNPANYTTISTKALLLSLPDDS